MDKIMNKTKIQEYLNQMIHLLNGSPQQKYYQFLLKEGKSFNTRKNINLSGISAKPKNCFNNSILINYSLDYDYYEGFYLFNNISVPFEHAFNLDKSNNLVDVTAQKNNFNVDEWFGVKLDKKYIDEFLNSKYNGVTTPLNFYYAKYIK